MKGLMGKECNKMYTQLTYGYFEREKVMAKALAVSI